MWSGRGFRNGAGKAVAEALRPTRGPAFLTPCRRCLSHGLRRSATPVDTLRFDRWSGPQRFGPARASSSLAVQDEEFVSQAEADQAKLLDSAKQKVDEYISALSEVRDLWIMGNTRLPSGSRRHDH